MGALQMGLTEDELPDIVQRWRQANPRIRDLWYAVENAALAVMRTAQPQAIYGLIFALEGIWFTVSPFNSTATKRTETLLPGSHF